ncbi:MAG: hypothetical protein ACT4QD_09680 [Acidobacteriota bacterium]
MNAWFADEIPASRAWRSGGFPRRRTFSPGRILLAGLAVLAAVKLVSAVSSPNRSRAEKLGLGALLVLVGAFLLSLRRSPRRIW